MISLSLNGYTDIPNGKVANIATFLEMSEKPEMKTPLFPELPIELQTDPDLLEYKALFKKIGTDWLWFSRLTLSDEALAHLLQRKEAEIFFLKEGGQNIGLLELDLQDPKNIEVAYFGLVAGAVGRSVGSWLMAHGIKRAFDHHRASRLWLHTCTMDHPAALTFYMKCGFRPYKRAIEIADDPRLSGHIPRQSGKHHPIIEP